MLDQNVGPVEAVRRSRELLEKKYTTDFYVRAEISTLIVLVPTMALIFVMGCPLFVMIVATQNFALLFSAVIAAIIVASLLSLVSAALNSVIYTTLYEHLVKGNMWEEMDAQVVRDFITPMKGVARLRKRRQQG